MQAARPAPLSPVAVPTRARVLDALVLAAPVLVVATVAVSAAAAPSRLVPAARHAFPGWLAGPLPKVGTPLGPAALGVALVVLLGLYLYALRAAPRFGTRPVVISIVAAHAVLFLGPPLLSGDVFGYIGYGRLADLHHVSPYAHGAVALGNDPVRSFILWHDARDPYGPLFTLAGFAVALLGVAAALWTYKAIAVTASLACVAIVVRTAPRVGLDPARAAVLVGLNPILLVFAVGGAHNDLVIAALTAAAAALVALAARPRRRALRLAAGATGVLAIVALSVFGGQLGGMAGALAEQQRLVAAHSVPAELAGLLGHHGLPAFLRALAMAALVAAMAVLLARAWRGGDPVSAAGWATAALLATTAWLLPWYLVWLLPLAALARDRRLELAALAFTGYLVATRVPFLLG